MGTSKKLPTIVGTVAFPNLKKYLFLVYECFGCTYICVPTVCVPGAHGGQKEVFYHLELELTDSFELSCGCWELDSSPLEEHPVHF